MNNLANNKKNDTKTNFHNFQRNNLNKASSPYLQQHKNNPIYWQQWTAQTLNYAKQNNKLILVSIGYTTCHWCHVMANEAFSNKEIADYLNQHFVSIKVDREQRPDIDQYMMSFITQTQAQGGWPLNVILTPDAKPFLAVTYLPVQPKYDMPTFGELLQFAKKFYEQNKDKITLFIPQQTTQTALQEQELITTIKQSFDITNTGFGAAPKFPPHNTLLFLLHYYEQTKDAQIAASITKTLDTIALRGLHDHLQGGFFRYCTDAAWTIPHFEKMLYDQAMLLIVYSAAYKLFKKQQYKTIVEKIIFCLEETFNQNNLYYSAHDADTNHEEGTTYLWTKQQLQNSLTAGEFFQLEKLYEISEQGNFDGKIHLIKKAAAIQKIQKSALGKIEQKLLLQRALREQPFVDKKIITSWNCLIGIGFLYAYRYTKNEKARDKAIKLFYVLKERHYKNGKLVHSSLNNQLQEQEFLQDYAAFLLFATYIHEETGEEKELMKELSQKLQTCNHNNQWIESNNDDFQQITAQDFDHPTPSSVAVAEFAVFRIKMLLEQDCSEDSIYKYPLQNDFHNLVTFLKKGNVHIIHTKEKIDWQLLPLNSVQIISNHYQDCYKQSCREFMSKEELIRTIRSR